VTLGVVVLSMLGVASAQAELQRVEAVGIYGIRDSMRSQVVPRDEAIARARWEGVSRVARELLGEAGLATATDETDGEGDSSKQEAATLESALGKDMLPYTRSYRILKDQGERPVLFEDSPGIKREYVVVVEVIVDVDRVNAALERSGLIAGSDPGEAGEAVLLEVVGLARYEALQTVVAALRDRYGATRVRTLVFENERQLLSVEGPFDADGLLSRLSRYRNPRLILEPLGVDAVSGQIRVMGRWLAEDEPS
jgi:hypothetical protein